MTIDGASNSQVGSVEQSQTKTNLTEKAGVNPGVEIVVNDEDPEEALSPGIASSPDIGEDAPAEFSDDEDDPAAAALNK